MSNKVKYNKTGTEPNSLFKGNWAIDVSDNGLGGGPSSSTGLYNGAEVPVGGYLIYSPVEVYKALNGDELMAKIKDLGGDYSSVSAAITWAATQPDIFIVDKDFDNIVTDGLVLNLDAGDVSSFNDSEPTTNLILQMTGGIAHPQIVYRSTAIEANVLDSNTPGGKYSRFTGIDGSSNNQLYTLFNSAGIDVRNTTVTYSVYLRGSGTCHLTIYSDNKGYITSPTITLNGDWTRYSITDSLTNYTNNAWVAVRGILNTTDVFMAAQQAEFKSYATPFVNGTRAQNTTLYDLSGGANNSTLINGPTFGTTEGISCFKLDGINDYIQSPKDLVGFTHNIQYDIDWTIECWLYMNPHDGLPQHYTSIYGNYNGCNYSTRKGNAQGFIIYFAAVPAQTTVNFSFGPLNSTPGNQCPNVSMNWPNAESGWVAANINKWCHFVMTSDDGTYYKIFVNGVQQGSTKVVDFKNSQLRIDNDLTASSNYGWGGNGVTSFSPYDYAMMRMYNKPLSQAEILQNFNAQRTRFGI